MKAICWISTILLATAILMGCNQTSDDTKKHTHRFGEWNIVTEATCTQEGSKERKCDCGETESESVVATGHELVMGVCINCGYIDQQTILEIATMQFVTLERLPDGTYAVKSNDLGQTATELTIPAEYEGKKITAIAADAFRYNEKLTSITLPDSITVIGASAFESCIVLKNIVLPESVIEIGERAFFSCHKLTKLTIPAATVKIGADAFKSAALQELTVAEGNSVYHSQNNALIHTADKVLVKATQKTTQIPSDGSVTKIAAGAFYRILGISQLTVPEGVTEIGKEAFYCCTDLTKLYLPTSLAALGERFVTEPDGGEILHIYYAKTLSDWESLSGDYSWIGGNWYGVVLDADDQSKHYQHDHRPTGEYEIETSCTEDGIEWYACVCGDRYKVNLAVFGHDYYADECTRCGEKAPDGNFLVYKLLPDGTWSVVGNGGYTMTDVLVIPSTYQGKPVTVVAKDAFNRNVYDGIIIKEGVKIIEANAFKDGYDIVFVQLPNSLEVIGDGAFSGCYNLPEFVIPAGVKEIGAQVFNRCSKITKMTIPSNVKKLGSQVFGNCTGLNKIVIEEGLTEIGANAFGGCKALTEIVIPNSVTHIGGGAFYNCQKLKSLTLSQNLTTIEDGLVEWCESLEKLTIPASVTAIKGTFTFYMASITELVIENPNIRIDSSVFNGVPTLTMIRFGGTVEQWKAAGSGYTSSFPMNCTVYCTDGTERLQL